MTKILCLIDGLPYGGAERQLSLLLKYLSPVWETRVVSLGDGPYHKVLNNQRISVAVHQRRSRFDLIPVFGLYSEIIRYKPDIVHSWGSLCSALVAPLCKVLRISFIDGSIRIANSASRHYWRRRVTFSLSDYIVTNSYAGLSAYRVPAGKSCTIYNAFDPDRLKLIKHKNNAQMEITTVVMTGRISPFKDFSSFFEAARRLSAQEPGHWKFVAVGAGNENDHRDFRKLAEDLIVAGVVELPQAGLEVIPYLQEASIGALLSAASFKEGISNSIMEYMACGLPVICSDSGGNRELVIDGQTGFVIPSEDVNAFIEKLLFLKKHPDNLHVMGEAGQRRVMALCSIERMINEYETLYTKMLSKRHKRISRNRLLRKMNERGNVER